MVANVSSSVATPNRKVSSRGPSPVRVKRAPLLPSDADNNGPLKSREVSSRYLSSTASSSSSLATTMTTTSFSSSFSSTTTTSSSSNSVCTPRRRFPSPLVSSTNLMTPASTMNKRALSTERRRPVTPRISEMSTTAKMLTKLPARSLSASFQGQSLAVQVSKASKSPTTGSINGSRRDTPEKRAVTPVRKPRNPKAIDQQRWPGRQGSLMTKSVDFTNENMKLSGSGIVTALRALQKPMIRETRLKPNKPEINRGVDKVISDSDNSDRATSDVESVSSGGTPGNIQGVKPGALMVPARYRQETVNRLRRVQPEPVSPPVSRNVKLPSVNRCVKEGPALSPRGLSPSPVRRAVQPASPSKSVLPQLKDGPGLSPRGLSPSPVRKAVRPASPSKSVLPLLKDGPALSPRGISPSPVRRAVRPASPSKSVMLSASSPSRGMSSPARVWSGIGSTSNVGNTPSILSFAAETRRRKAGDDAIADAHALRLLHNTYLQWRFANARADAGLLVQSTTAQKNLYNSWVTTLKIRQSVISKQIMMQQLRQNLKLYTVLRNQIPYLEVWDQVERDHIVSLSETIVSLESSTLRLPLVDGAKVNVQCLKDAICSAADVVQAMASFIRSLEIKVEHVNALASELVNTTRNERSMIDRYKDMLSILTRMEVQDRSLRTHILQLQRLAPTTITEL